MAERGRSWIRIGPLAAVLVLSAALGNAQKNASGSLAGKLTDWYSTPLDGATVTVRNGATGQQARVIVGKNGAYKFTGLEPGNYTLEADSPQLGRGVVDGIVVSAGHEAHVQAAMQMELPRPAAILAAFHEMSPATQAVTTTLPAEQLQQLPLTGRRWQDFVLDTPTASTSAGGQGQTALRGAGQQPAAMTVDGASRTLAFGATAGEPDGASGQREVGAAWAQGRGAGLAGPAQSQTAIREVQTAAGNVEAESSHGAGGAMNTETLRGSNALHGQAFAFDRQNQWGAQNPFTQWVKETAPANLIYNPVGPPLSVPVFTPEPYTPPDREFTWGAGLGGRIRRDKLFWFGALDGYERNDPGLAMVKHPDLFFAQPSNCQMQVLAVRLDLAAQGPPNNCVSGLVAGLTAYSGMLQTLAGLLGPAPRTALQWVGFGRLDWEATERHRFTLEGTGALWNSPGGGLTRVSETFGNSSFGSSRASEEWLLGRWEAFLTPNLLAVTQGSWGRDVVSAHAETPSPFEQTFLGPNVWGQLPQIVVDSSYGFTIGNPSRFGTGSYPDERLFEGQETVDWIRGGLLVKAGFELSHNSDATSLLRNQTGTYNYASVVNFASDALVFEKYGIQNALNPDDQHHCYTTDKGFGNIPCYSSYSQTMGPTDWQLATNDWAGFVTAQWQPAKLLVFSAGLRWEREQLPPPIALTLNPQLPMADTLPSLGNEWGPRASLALGSGDGHWPVLRLGYGMYFGRTANDTVETALTQTGSPNGDLRFFMRPTDDLLNNGGGAPPFPYVFQGEPLSVVTPGATEFAPGFHNPEVHQAVAALEETLPGHIEVTGSALVSLGRRLLDTAEGNLASPVKDATITYNVCDQTPVGIDNTACGHTGLGPIKATQITVPLYASWPAAECPAGAPLDLAGQCGWINPNYQDIAQYMSRVNSTYEAAVLRVERYGRRGLSVYAHYTYSHAMDWNPNASPLDPSPAAFSQEYGTSDLDTRHAAAAMVVYEAPWKLHNLPGKLANGWMLSGIGQFRSGLPYTMRTAGSLAEQFTDTSAAIVGLAPGINGSGGDNRVYGLGNDHVVYNIGRNTFRYPATWKADLRLGKSFDLGQMRRLELLAESFNLFNHQNVTELETTGYTIQAGSPPSASGTPGTPPSLTFLTGQRVSPTTGLASPEFGQPLNINATNFYRERQIQIGVRMRF